MSRSFVFTLALMLSFVGVVGSHAEAAKRLPDLIVSAVSAPSTAQSGQNFVFSASIKNQGRASANNVQAAFYLTKSSSSITGATLLGTQNVGSLPAGAILALTTTLSIPSSTSPGTFYVVAVADPSNATKESKETNNTRASGAIAVTVPVSTQATVWITDSLTRVQPTDPPGTSTTATIKAARNEYEAFQVIVTAPSSADLVGVNVDVSDLVGLSTIAKSNIALYRAHYIHVSSPSTFPNNGWNSPYPPGQWPDALIPSTVPGGTYPSFPFPVAAGTNQPVYVEVYVPKETPAGTYTGTITVTATGQSPIAVPVTLTAWNFTLPNKPAIASDFWGYDLSLERNYIYSTGATLSTLRTNLYTDLRKHRIGLGESGTASPFPNAALDTILQIQARMQASWKMTDTKLQELVTAYGSPQLYAQHFDEPKDQATLNAINDPNGEAQRYRRNGVPELLTVSWPYIGWQANVDIFVGVHDALIPFTNAQTKLNAGKTVWSYAAGIQPNEAPTWLLDYSLTNFRIVPWLDYSTGLNGFLYWTPVNWCPGDPWTNAGSSSNTCAAGEPIDTSRNMEGVFYYPGSKVGAPNAAIPSLRLKALRDGVEDYDYLALLAQLGDPGLAAQLAASLAPAWDNWSHDQAALASVREQAATRIVALGGR